MSITFSIVIPVYNSNPKYLTETIKSITDQTYPDWQIVIVDDASTTDDNGDWCRRMLSSINPKKQLFFRLRENSGIQVATDLGISHATGTHICLSDHDDRVHPECLEKLAQHIEKTGHKFVYTNHCLIDEKGDVKQDLGKPDWNREFIYQCMYLGHIMCFDGELAKTLVQEREGSDYGPSQDWDLALRMSEHLKDNEIGHIDEHLYQWRIHGGGHQVKPTWVAVADQCSKNAIHDHLKRIGKDKVMEVFPTGTSGRYGVKRHMQGNPKIAVIVPTRDKVVQVKAFIDSFERETECSADLHILFHCEGEETSRYIQQMRKLLYKTRHNIHEWHKSFNYAAMMNFMVAKLPDYEYYVFTNDDVILGYRAIDELVALMTIDKTVGITGAKLYFPGNRMNYRMPLCWTLHTDTIQHAGVSIGAGLTPGHAYYNHPNSTIETVYVREVEAVTFALAAVRKEVMIKFPFDETWWNNYNDVDLCMRARQGGYKVMFTPWAVSWHSEGASRKAMGMCEVTKELALFRQKWQGKYNPNI